MAGSTSEYHIPVMLHESIDGLKINPDGIYLDVTFGGGGHSKEILSKLNKGKLFAFDKDTDAQKNALSDDRFTLFHHDFIYLRNFMEQHEAVPVDGIIADLGVSSHQFDSESRGFSFRFESDLDMRMDTDTDVNAKEILNHFDQVQLQKIFSEFGEIRNARTLAQKIVDFRQTKQIQSTSDLNGILEKCLIKGENIKNYASQVYQSLRIKVNDELSALKQLLLQSREILKSGGRLVIISYHSLEDRLVKDFTKTGNFDGVAEKDMFGNIKSEFIQITKKPIVPTENEIALNPRSRSAKLRIAEKI